MNYSPQNTFTFDFHLSIKIGTFGTVSIWTFLTHFWGHQGVLKLQNYEIVA